MFDTVFASNKIFELIFFAWKKRTYLDKMGLLSKLSNGAMIAMAGFELAMLSQKKEPVHTTTVAPPIVIKEDSGYVLIMVILGFTAVMILFLITLCKCGFQFLKTIDRNNNSDA